MSNFPSSLPSAGSASSSATLAASGHTALHNNGADESRAIATKVGTGSSTPTTGTVLRASGMGTSSWAQVNLATDVTGVLPVAQGGTGTTGSTGNQNVVLSTSPTITTPAIVTPTIITGGSWAGSPTITTPTIADFTNAQHTHNNAAGGGTLNAANALQAGTVSFANLLSTIFSGQVTTYTNPGTAGGTSSFFYINLGGIKLFWGLSAAQTTGTGAGAGFTITLPAGFFSTVQYVSNTPTTLTGHGEQYGLVLSQSTTTVTLNAVSPGGAGTAVFSVLVIGT